MVEVPSNDNGERQDVADVTPGLLRLREAVRLCDSYTRLPTLLALDGQFEAKEWLTVLGEEWNSCDNIGAYTDELWESLFEEVLQTGAGRDWLMTDAEREAYARLPEEVPVFRGCYARNKWGLSWSLDRTTAESFPMLQRYRRAGQPLLVKAIARKQRIAALKLDRGEAEVIVWRPKHVSTSHIRLS